jgi:hypothetical protein
MYESEILLEFQGGPKYPLLEDCGGNSTCPSPSVALQPIERQRQLCGISVEELSMRSRAQLYVLSYKLALFGNTGMVLWS